jgi:hypothetical protein
MIEEGITEKEWTERLIRQGCKFTLVTVACCLAMVWFGLRITVLLTLSLFQVKSKLQPCFSLVFSAWRLKLYVTGHLKWPEMYR